MASFSLTRTPYLPTDIHIERESILLTDSGEAIPVHQVMPKYIPKEPTKACVSSPLRDALTQAQSQQAATYLYSDTDSEIGNHSRNMSRVQSSESLQLGTRTKRRGRIFTPTNNQLAAKPVNVVGPLLLAPLVGGDSASCGNAEGAFEDTGYGEAALLREELSRQEAVVQQLTLDLRNQIQVNTELKKLLVASVGNDLEYRVEKLARDKARLSETVGSYSERLYQDFEDLDRISIEADMWKSKFLASRMQAEELFRSKAALVSKYSEAAAALQALLDEHHQIRTHLTEADRLLTSYLHEGQGSTSVSFASPTVKSLAEQLLSLSQGLSSRQHKKHSGDLGGCYELPHCVKQDQQQINSSYDITWSSSELAAYKVLSNQAIPEALLSIPHSESIPRNISSHVCKSDLPRCGCKHCKGTTIQV